MLDAIVRAALSQRLVVLVVAAALLAFMDKSGGAPPRGWRGFRELTEK